MFYRRVGDVPPKRHTVHQQSGGHRLIEELVGEEGFSDISSLLYHRRSPSALLAAEAVDETRCTLSPLRPLVPLHVRTTKLPAVDDPVLGRHLLLGNDDVRISAVRARTSSGLYRDAVGDELVYVQSGEAVLESSFGVLAVRPGDYVVVPAGVVHRWVVAGMESLDLLVIESSGHIKPPRRYLSTQGQFLEFAPYCERDIRSPEGPLVIDDESPADVVVRSAGGLTRHTYANHPFDVVGWDGCLYPWAFSIYDFEPIVGSLHQPPPVHQTFEGPGFVVCSFVPRPYDFNPAAVKIPYHHANVDSDEVLFYSAGDFMSRAGSGIDVGSLTLHPAGFVHGPQPGSYERSVPATRTEELAVMLDTFRPLLVSRAARQAADPAYAQSWA
jgi:homogentisate 1,2-dioxygenase